ncbi:MAG: tetratricopeptide repeat protein [Bacteroidota bacterium]
MKRIIPILLICISFCELNAQSYKEIADSVNALMNKNLYSKAIPMLENAIKSAPDDFDANKTLGICYLKSEKEKKAIQIFEKLKADKKFGELEFKYLANAYFQSKKKEDAVAVIKQGLSKFPNSGLMFEELGMMELKEGKFQNAIKYWDMGISASPQYDGNYFCEAKLFANSPQKVWGIFYSELFLCLTKDTLKAAEISKSLHAIYTKNIQIYPDSFTVDLITETNVNMPTTNEKIKLPFINIFEKLMFFAVQPIFINQEKINTETISKIRINFTTKLFETGMDKEHPSIVFNWHRQLLKNNYLEAYNYWLLRYADAKAFNGWKEKNTDKYDAFIEFMNENALTPDEENRFVRMQ